VIQIEITGSESAIAVAEEQVAALAVGQIRTFQHKGAAGEAGVVGLLMSIATAAVPKLIELLKRMTTNDRDLTVVINGLELKVKDIGEATEVLDLLISRGVLPKAKTTSKK
jgi:hypothetical protein